MIAWAACWPQRGADATLWAQVDAGSDLSTQRRIFLKVLVTGPVVACAGTDPASPALGEAGSSVGEAGSGASVGGQGQGTAGRLGSAGSPYTVGGTSSGGNGVFFPSGGGSTASGSGGSSVGTGSGGTGTAGTGTAGTGTSSSGFLTPAGNVSGIPVGALIIADGIVFVGRDAQGLYAMSMQCPHKGCAVVFSGNELDCPCHHSRFDRNGNVLVGPATSPLPHLAVFVDGAGNVSVDRYTVVSLSARTPI